jgi:hypothetical protein
VSVPRWLLGRRSDSWPRVLFNTIRSGLEEPCRELHDWGRKPRRSLARTHGVLILWAVLAPITLIVDRAELLLGLVYPVSLGSHVMGLPLLTAGVVVGYVDVVYLRRPVTSKTDRDQTW